MKFLTPKAVITMVIFTIICSCGNQDDDSLIQLTEAESLKILESPEMQSFQANRKLFIIKVQEAVSIKGHSLMDLKVLTTDAIENENDDVILEVLFGNKDTGLTFLNDLNVSRQKLLKAYPIMDKIRQQQESPNARDFDVTSNFYDNLNEISRVQLVFDPENRFQANLNSEEGDGEIVCGSAWNIVRLSVCAAACSGSTGGIGTALCGWA